MALPSNMILVTGSADFRIFHVGSKAEAGVAIQVNFRIFMTGAIPFAGAMP